MSTELLRQSLDTSDLGRLAYEFARDFRGGNLSDQDIAQGGNCMLTAPFLTAEVSRRIASIGLIDLVTFHEAHSVLINVASYSGDVASFSHEYTTVGYAEVPSDEDFVDDGTYKQFLRDEAASHAPNVFLGTRLEALELMKRAAKKRYAPRLYEVSTLTDRRAA